MGEDLSICWLFSIDDISFSSIGDLRNSNEKRFGQVDLGGDPVWVWCLMGFWGGSEISLKEY